jgi:CRISPR-associated protein Cst2
VNIFATVLTYAAPSANYRGESELNRLVMQRITRGRFEYPVVSPEAMRNALRETLRTYGLPCNRERLTNEEQLAVRFEDFPFPERWADDFFFGYLVADRRQVPAATARERNLQFKRDSILRMNLAVGLEPYRHDTVFTQSPLTVKNDAAPWQNAASSALLHRETAYTAFQYPFAINVDDCRLDDAAPPVAGVTRPDGGSYATRGEQNADWLRYLLRGISELSGVAGNHARSYFQMAPASIVTRVTDALVSGADLYAFQSDGTLPEIVEGILTGDLPGSEFLLGGQVVREKLAEEIVRGLRERGATLYRKADGALDAAARRATGGGFLLQPAAEVS